MARSTRLGDVLRLRVWERSASAPGRCRCGAAQYGSSGSGVASVPAALRRAARSGIRARPSGRNWRFLAEASYAWFRQSSFGEKIIGKRQPTEHHAPWLEHSAHVAKSKEAKHAPEEAVSPRRWPGRGFQLRPSRHDLGLREERMSHSER